MRSSGKKTAKSANSDITTVNIRSVGIDVHKDKFVACFAKDLSKAEPNPQADPRTESISYEYMTVSGSPKDRKDLIDWILARNPDVIIMESTGIYWKAIFAEMEEAGLRPELINPRHFHSAEEGRKTDKSDAQWLANLGRLGLYRASFIPEEPMRSLRLIVVAQHKLRTELIAAKNRLQKILDDAGIHLATLFSDPSEGKTSQAIVQLILDEKLSVEAVEEVRDGRCRFSAEEIVAVCQGKLSFVSKTLVQMYLDRINKCRQNDSKLEILLEEQLTPYNESLDRLESVPGINRDTARNLIAICGDNLGDHFRSASQFSRWAGVCPGNHESAGVRKSSRCPHGLTTFKTQIVEAAQAASRCKATEFYELYRQKRHKGHNKAIMAIAHRLTRLIYLLLITKTYYKSPYFNYESAESLKKRPRWVKKFLELVHAGAIKMQDYVLPPSATAPITVKEPI